MQELKKQTLKLKSFSGIKKCGSVDDSVGKGACCTGRPDPPEFGPWMIPLWKGVL